MIAIANSRENLIQEIIANDGEYRSDRQILCWHGESKPSGHIKQCDDGKWRYHCFGCGFHGDEHDIRMVRTGDKLKGIVVNNNPLKTEPPKPIAYTREQIKSILDQIGTNRATYQYKDIQDRLIGSVVRIQLTDMDKTFRQITPAGKHESYLAGPKEKWPLYKLQDIQPGTVILVEGEQCADLLREMDFNATTWAGGCKAYGMTDWAYLSGRHVILWPDYDEGGRKASEAIREILQGLECTVAIIDIDSLGFAEKGSDIKQYIAAGHAKDDVQQLIGKYEKQTASQRAQRRSERLLNGELKPVELPWPILGHTTQAMIPGMVIVVVGTGGAGKSLFLMQAMRVWTKKHIKVACLMLESGKDYHISRAVAQEACEPGWLDNEWQSDPNNAGRIWAIHNQHHDLMDSMEKVIFDAPPFMATIEYTLEWLACRGKAGCRVAIIDPVTMVHYNDPRQISAGTKRLVKTCIDLAIKYEMTIILVNHYGKDGETMQGGASLQDHTDVIFEFKSFPEPTDVKLIVPHYSSYHEMGQVNRLIYVKKARKGHLCWHKIGYYFDKNSLTYAEKGVIVTSKNK